MHALARTFTGVNLRNCNREVTASRPTPIWASIEPERAYERAASEKRTSAEAGGCGSGRTPKAALANSGWEAAYVSSGAEPIVYHCSHSGHLPDQDYLTSTGETAPRPGVP